jgi:hypothetical protein
MMSAMNVAVSGSFCWCAILMARLPQKLLVLDPGCASPSSSERLSMRETHDRDAASPAGLLKKVIPPRHEILKLVLPEKDRVQRFRKLSSQPRPLKNQLQDDVD